MKLAHFCISSVSSISSIIYFIINFVNVFINFLLISIHRYMQRKKPCVIFYKALIILILERFHTILSIPRLLSEYFTLRGQDIIFF